MIPAIFAAPAVEGIVGGVVGTVANLFAPSGPTGSVAPSSASISTTFNPYLNNATAAANATPSATITPSSGIMRSSDWDSMDSTDQTSWAKGLTGKHVDATDNSGRTITGTVSGMQMVGSTLALNIGGHLVSLSQLKQISWSPAIA